MSTAPTLPPRVTLGDLMSRPMPSHAEDRHFTIRITNPGGLSGHQTVDASHVGFGIDWEGRQLVVTPAVPLTTLTPEQVADLQTSARKGQSWHAYQALKARNEKHKAEVAAFAQRVEELEQLLEQVAADAKAQGVLFEWWGPIDAARKGEQQHG